MEDINRLKVVLAEKKRTISQLLEMNVQELLVKNTPKAHL